jgi:putative hydrolase of the HAD superfamily
MTATAPGAIKAIVFDFAGVLFDWRPLDVVARVLPQRAGTPEAATHWVAEIFQSYGGDWGDFDSGQVDTPELVDRISRRTGLAPSEVRAVVDAVPPSLAPLPGTVSLVRRLKAVGWPLHFLSNMPEPYARYLERTHDVIAWFDTGLFSARAGVNKPHAAIYHQLQRGTGLAAHELLFIDDHAPNVDAARALGWQALVFTGADALEAELTRRSLLGEPA